MTDREDPRCPRCGAPLRTETVKVPVKKWITNEVTGKPEHVFDRYEDRQEVSDCIRCQGAY